MGKFKTKAPKTGYIRPISAMTETPGREWRRVAVQDVQVGDIIAGMGVVKTIFQTCRSDEYYLEAGESVEGSFDATKEVFAFVRKVN